MSWLAFWQNCAALEPVFAAENGGAPYPYSFYGNPNYTAFNRLDCVFFIWSFHTGQLPPGPGVGVRARIGSTVGARARATCAPPGGAVFPSPGDPRWS